VSHAQCRLVHDSYIDPNGAVLAPASVHCPDSTLASTSAAVAAMDRRVFARVDENHVRDMAAVVARCVAAARRVEHGICVSCAWDLGVGESIGNRVAPQRWMARSGLGGERHSAADRGIACR
jgi:hypothetical protein